MVTATVLYKLPPQIGLAACAAHFRGIAPGFRAVPGLRKQFIYAEDGWAGGVYLWQSRAAAECSMPGRGWRASASATAWTRRSSSFRTACVTNNAAGAVVLPGAAQQ